MGADATTRGAHIARVMFIARVRIMRGRITVAGTIPGVRRTDITADRVSELVSVPSVSECGKHTVGEPAGAILAGAPTGV